MARRQPTVLTKLRLSEQEREAIEASGGRVVAAAGEQPYEPADLAAAEIWLGSGLDAGLLAAMPRLTWVQATSAGVEAFLFPELVQSGVMLTNIRGMHSDTVAEHVLALMLSFARNLPAYARAQERREWQAMPGHELAGMSLAIVGLGAIGRLVARLGLAFGMRVVGVRRSARPAETEQAEPMDETDGGVSIVGPEELLAALADADWVVLAVPLTEETRHLIGRRELLAMRPASVLVNVARGGVVDEAALVEALRDGVIGGACLDVFEEEPLAADSPLWSLPNVIVTPHAGGVTRAYQSRGVQLFCGNLRRYLAGEALLNVVDTARGY